MTTIVGLATFGFLLGMRHALEADHIAAVATLSTRSTSLREGVMLGAFWGLGHSLVLLVVGSVVLLADTVMPERLAIGLELAVGVMLVVLGTGVLRRLVQSRYHVHVHRHEDGLVHLHAHSHATHSGHDHSHGLSKRALLVGLVHGLAGSAALVLLALSQATTVFVGLLYVAVFGLGSILGMALPSAAISLPLHAARRMAWLHTGLQLVTGLGSIALGIVVIYDLGRPFV